MIIYNSNYDHNWKFCMFFSSNVAFFSKKIEKNNIIKNAFLILDYAFSQIINSLTKPATKNLIFFLINFKKFLSFNFYSLWDKKITCSCGFQYRKYFFQNRKYYFKKKNFWILFVSKKISRIRYEFKFCKKIYSLFFEK